MKLAIPSAIFLGATALMVACAPVVSTRGYISDPALESSIRQGADTKSTIQERLGYASTTATFGGDNVWYYISYTEKQIAFFNPTVLNRKILAVSFDPEGKVNGTRRYGLENGRLIAFEQRQTPARGREYTFLQSILNASAGGDTSPIQDVNPGGGGLP
jgi:outer membrane protein assembly factor BamE (lipoprotein component of BamABCDE complex)